MVFCNLAPYSIDLKSQATLHMPTVSTGWGEQIVKDQPTGRHNGALQFFTKPMARENLPNENIDNGFFCLNTSSKEVALKILILTMDRSDNTVCTFQQQMPYFDPAPIKVY